MTKRKYLIHAGSMLPYIWRKNGQKKAAKVAAHPGLSVDTQWYLNHCLQGGAVCFDTFHMSRQNSDGESINWQEVLEVLPNRAIKMLHVHPTQRELEAFLNDEQSPLGLMLWELRKKVGVEIPAVIEVFPKLDSLENVIKHLEALRWKAHYYLG